MSLREAKERGNMKGTSNQPPRPPPPPPARGGAGRSDTWTPLPGALYDGAGRVVAMMPGAPDPWYNWGNR